MRMTKSEAERVLGELQHGRPRYQLAGRTQVADLELRIRLVAAWCSKFLDPGSIAHSLRPPRLAPHPLYGDRWDAVHDVSRAREREMQGDASWNAPRLDGRWLTYFPDADLADGAAEAATNGFLDAHNAPPWGTWLGYFDDRTSDPSYSSYLVAWVPLSSCDWSIGAST
jgi:hypothetical protein